MRRVASSLRLIMPCIPLLRFSTSLLREEKEARVGVPEFTLAGSWMLGVEAQEVVAGVGLEEVVGGVVGLERVVGGVVGLERVVGGVVDVGSARCEPLPNLRNSSVLIDHFPHLIFSLPLCPTFR